MYFLFWSLTGIYLFATLALQCVCGAGNPNATNPFCVPLLVGHMIGQDPIVGVM